MTWWIVGLVLTAFAGFALGRWWPAGARSTQPSHDETTAIENLQAVNALLRTLTSAPDITRSLFELALRIRAIVPCDRVGLALLSEDREGYSTYTARLDETSGGEVPRAQLHFQRRSTVIDEVVASRRGRIIDDVSGLAPEFLDANVVRSAGFLSVVMVPLIFDNEAIGTLNLVARRARAFSENDLHALEPVAEALAVSHGNRRLAHTLARHQMANELSEMTFAFSNDMSGAVQVIIGQCELLAHQLKDPAIEGELSGMLQQAKRLREILNNMQRMTREHVATTSRPQ